MEVFNIKKVSDADYAVKTSFEHSGYFLHEVHNILDDSFEALFSQDRQKLKNMKKKSEKIQSWANIITANIFKTLRLLQTGDPESTHEYAKTITALQEIAESVRDGIMRAYVHINNNHKGLLDIQIEELKIIKSNLLDILEITSKALLKKEALDDETITAKNQNMKKHIQEFDKKQIKRIQNKTSKTRLSILFYGLTSDSQKISEQTLNLLRIFHNSFTLNTHDKS